VAKKKTKKKARRGNSRKPSSVEAPGADRKIQKQIYITQGMIDDLEEDRMEREGRLNNDEGISSKLSWSANVEAILAIYLKKRKKAGAK
jgi:hypothetical protein